MSEPLAAAAARRLRRRRAECLTLAIHLAEALDHVRCLERARLTSSLGSSPSADRGLFSESRSLFFRLFLRQSTTPIMRTMRVKARVRESARFKPVMLSVDVERPPQPLGKEGMVEDVMALVAEETESSSTGSSVGVEVSRHCEIWGVLRDEEDKACEGGRTAQDEDP